VNAQEYHRRLIAQIDALPTIVSSNITFREIDENECYIKAVLMFATGHELHLAEYVVLQGEQPSRLKYRYQLLSREHAPLARWDNAPHHKELATFPDHWHDRFDQTHPSRIISPIEAIAESLTLIERPE
jgi:hypothetical protein